MAIGDVIEQGMVANNGVTPQYISASGVQVIITYLSPVSGARSGNVWMVRMVDGGNSGLGITIYDGTLDYNLPIRFPLNASFGLHYFHPTLTSSWGFFGGVQVS